MEPKAYKSIFSPAIARKLIKAGYVVYDIKPDKYSPQKCRTIFIFEATEEFNKELEAIVSERKNSTQELSEKGIELGIIDP